MTMADTLNKLGMTLGVVSRYGMSTVQEALAACKQGTATPEQQKITYQFLIAATGTKDKP